MFAYIMSGIYIHRASNKYIVLSLSLLLYTLYFFFSILFNAFPLSRNAVHAQHQYLVKMDNSFDSATVMEFIQNLEKELEDLRVVSWEMRDRNKAWADIREKTGAELFENPLHDYIIVNSSKPVSPSILDAFLEEKRDILDIEYIQNVQKKAGINSLGKLQFILLPLMIFSFVLFLSILQGAAQSNLTANKKVIESLMLAGAHHSKMSAVFRKNGLLNFTVAAAIAIVLYLTTIYLIKSGFNLQNADFKTGIIIKSILIPSFVIFGIHTIILVWKVDKYLKSI